MRGVGGGGALRPLQEVPEAQGAASYPPTSAPSAVAGLVCGFICEFLSGFLFLFLCFVETDCYYVAMTSLELTMLALNSEIRLHLPPQCRD